jgi:predicted extracellular nuclease
MRREIVAIALLLLCAAFEAGAQVVFWNVENYFDTRDEPDREDGDFTPTGAYHWNRKRYQAKRNFIAKGLMATADSLGEVPAVIALAEVENLRVVRDLAENTPLAKTGYRTVHRDSPDARGIDVALLYDPSRVEVAAVEFLAVEGFRTREIMYCRLRPAGDTIADFLHLFVNHWPSKRGGAASSDERRDAVSALLRERLDSLQEEAPQARILLVGDFNDTPDGESLTSLCDICGLYNMALPLWRRGVGSIRYKGKWELIDQAIVSKRLAGEGASFSVFNATFLQEPDNAYLGLKPKRTFVGPRYNGGVSDHLPVLIRIKKERMR